MPPFQDPVRLTHAVICHCNTSSSAAACGHCSERRRSYSCVRFSSSFSSIREASSGSRAGDFFFGATRGGDTDWSRSSGLRLLVLRSADRVARRPSIAGDDDGGETRGAFRYKIAVSIPWVYDFSRQELTK
jgi:hypothetical protein